MIPLIRLDIRDEVKKNEHTFSKNEQIFSKKLNAIENTIKHRISFIDADVECLKDNERTFSKKLAVIEDTIKITQQMISYRWSLGYPQFLEYY